jgi:ferric-dicitrate binding protein FerR (iron transport regulator)
MSDEQETDRLKRISYEAACWYVLCSDDLSSLLLERRLEFADWIRSSPEHVRELLHISRMHKRMRRVKWIVRAVQATNVYSFPGSRHRQQNTESARSAVSSRRGVRRVAIAAAISLLLVCASTSIDMSETRRIETQAREVKHVPLSDGSVVHLNGLTKISIVFSGRERLVHLFEGEAVFEVAKDSARPFVVRTNLVDATAVGTRYGVAIDDGVTTTVSEGVVKVGQRGGGPGGRTITVSAGQELHTVGGSSVSSSKRNVDSERKLSWSSGWLVFRDDTLEDAAAALNRFNVTQIVVGSDELAKRRIQYHRARINEPEEFAKVMTCWPEVELVVDRENNRLLLLQKRK